MSRMSSVEKGTLHICCSLTHCLLQVQVMALLTHTVQVLQQMSILLRCCPSDEDGVSLQEWSPLPQCMLSPLAVSSSSDHLVRDVVQTIEVRLL